MDVSERFDRLFRAAEDLTPNLLKGAGPSKFQARVDRLLAMAAISPDAARILETAGRIRNINAHWPESAGAPCVIAAEHFVDCLSLACEELGKSDIAGSIFGKPIRVFSVDERLTSALRYMRDNDFSQSVVRDDAGRYGVLVSEQIHAWMLKHLSAEGIVIDGNCPITEIYDPEDAGEDTFFAFTRTSSSVREVCSIFQSAAARGAQLQAVVLTKDGSRSQIPVGMATPWDIATLGQPMGPGRPRPRP